MFDQRATSLGQVTGYSNSNFARDLDERCSLTGYVFQLSRSCVRWSATTETEFMSLSEVVKEVFGGVVFLVIWALRKLTVLSFVIVKV